MKRFRIRLGLMAASVACLFVAGGCGKDSPAAKKEGPAKVEKLPQETELTRITLTEEAEQHLSITLARVQEKTLPRRRTFGGEVIVPPGKSLIVSAPVPGTVHPPKQDDSIPPPGKSLAKGDPVVRLEPLLSPERYVPTPAERVQMASARVTLLTAQVIAKGDVDRAEAELEAARIAKERAEQLLQDMAGSARAVDEARAQYNVAESTLRAAKERKRELDKLAAELTPGAPAGTAPPMAITSPEAGTLRTLSVSPGQKVTAGAPLFEVINTQIMWVRVPVYAGLLDQLRPGQAELVGLDGRQAPGRRKVTVVPAPPSADPLSTTVDLFFSCDNTDGALRPGQRVGVRMAMRDEEKGLVVPAKSLLYDINGGTWAYVKTGPHQFERRRVLVRFTQGDEVVLDKGPPAGTEVVVGGAAELFGTEFGGGK